MGPLHVLILILFCSHQHAYGSSFRMRSERIRLKMVSLSSSSFDNNVNGNNDESPRLRKARLRLAEAQGRIPIGASEIPGVSLDQYKSDGIISPLSQSRVREISWRVAEPNIKYDPERSSQEFFLKPLIWISRNVQFILPGR